MVPLNNCFMTLLFHFSQRPDIEVIKLECSLKLKIKRNDWLLAERTIIVLYFESENELKFYNCKACPNEGVMSVLHAVIKRPLKGYVLLNQYNVWILHVLVN